MNGTKQVAEMTIRCDAWLVQTLKEAGNLSQEDAQKAAACYIKHKIAKRDLQAASFTFVHGAFLDADVIRKACAS
jgi:hypothetical protein